VARRTAEDQYIGINAGSSHIGMEFLLNYQLLQTSQFNYQAFRLRSIASHLKTLLMGTMNYSGNKLTGVPNAQWM
jgi:iron complex outermembrane receptor protein